MGHSTWETSGNPRTLLYKKKLRKLGLLSLEERKLHGELIVTLQYLKGVYREAGEELFVRNCSDRTRSNGYKLKEEKLS